MNKRKFVVTVTKNGYIKMSMAHMFPLNQIGRCGVVGTRVNEKTGEVVAMVSATKNDKYLLVITKLGTAVKFPTHSVRVIGRNTQGIKAIQLREDDEVVGLALLDA